MSATQNLSISIGYGLAGYTISSNTKTFKKENWVNLVGSEAVYYSNMPRYASTKYTNLIIGSPSSYADFAVTVVNIPEYTNKFKCYQTKWTFNITKRNSSLGYDTKKSNQELYCTSYFNA